MAKIVLEDIKYKYGDEFHSIVLPVKNGGTGSTSSLGKDEIDSLWKLITNENGELTSDKYVKKTGDTLTGKLNFNIPGDMFNVYKQDVGTGQEEGHPTKQTWSGTLYFDKNGKRIAYSQSTVQANGTSGISLVASNESQKVWEKEKEEEPATETNGIWLYVSPDGKTKNVTVSSGAEASWRKALNVVNKSGDTITGNLTNNSSSNSDNKEGRFSVVSIGKANSSNHDTISIANGTNRSGIMYNIDGTSTDGSAPHVLIGVNRKDILGDDGKTVIHKAGDYFTASPAKFRDALGLGSLATANTVAASSVTGLGSLATKSSVAASSVTGLGSLATKNFKVLSVDTPDLHSLSGNNYTTPSEEKSRIPYGETLPNTPIIVPLNNINSNLSFGEYGGSATKSNFRYFLRTTDTLHFSDKYSSGTVYTMKFLLIY